jgi:phage tail sheath gpL-like
MQALITPGTATIGTTTTLTANTVLTGGTTPDSNTTALATIKPGSYYYIISCDSDATNIGAIVTQVNTMAQPTNGIRQRVFAGSMDTLANTITIATGLNAARAEVIWGTCDDYQPLELAAYFAGLYSLLEAGAAVGVNRKNFSNFPSSATDQTSWLLKPGRAGVGGAPTQANLVSALNNGISPLSINNAGATYLVKRCTTRSLNGAVSDFRVRDPHKVSVCDFWGDDAAALTQLQFGGKDLLPDPKQGQPPPPAIAVTPSIWGGALKGLVTLYGNAGQFQNADVINSNADIQKETSPPNRLSALFQLTPVDICDQMALLALQTG